MIHSGRKKDLKNEKAAGLFDVIAESINLMQDRLMRDAILEHKPEILIEVSNHMSTIFDFYKAEMIIEEGRKAAAKALSGF